MSPRRRRKRNLGVNRRRGVVDGFNCETGRGVIKFGDHKLAFSVKDVYNYTPGTDLSGLVAHFEIEKNRDGNLKRASDIVIPDLSYRRYYPINPDDLDELDAPYTRALEVEERRADETPAPAVLSEEQRMAFALFGPVVKLITLSPDGRYQFRDEQQKLHNLLYVLSSETVAMERAVEEFEHLINEPKATEGDFQKFFEGHPDFILNDDYREAHPHLVLENARGEQLIPDFILKPVNQGAMCDLLELKLPSAQVFVMQKNRHRYAAAVHEAAAQLREYRDYFEQEVNRSRFQDRYPLLSLYRPRMFVIIGRQGTESQLVTRSIEAETSNLVLRTYDDVLERAKWKMGKMRGGLLQKALARRNYS